MSVNPFFDELSAEARERIFHHLIAALQRKMNIRGERPLWEACIEGQTDILRILDILGLLGHSQVSSFTKLKVTLSFKQFLDHFTHDYIWESSSALGRLGRSLTEVSIDERVFRQCAGCASFLTRIYRFLIDDYSGLKVFEVCISNSEPGQWMKVVETYYLTLEKISVEVPDRTLDLFNWHLPVSTVFPKMKSLELKISSGFNIASWWYSIEKVGPTVENLELEVGVCLSKNERCSLLDTLRKNCRRVKTISLKIKSLTGDEYMKLLGSYGPQLLLCEGLPEIPLEMCKQVLSHCSNVCCSFVFRQPDDLERLALLGNHVEGLEVHVNEKFSAVQLQGLAEAMTKCGNVKNFNFLSSVEDNESIKLINALLARRNPILLDGLGLFNAAISPEMVHAIRPSLTQLRKLTVLASQEFMAALVRLFEASPALECVDVKLYGAICVDDVLEFIRELIDVALKMNKLEYLDVTIETTLDWSDNELEQCMKSWSLCLNRMRLRGVHFFIQASRIDFLNL